MIIKGGSRSNAGFFAKYFTSEPGEDNDNERSELKDMRGVFSDNVQGFLQEVSAVASGTNCKNFLYHAHINPHPLDQMTPEQRLQSVDMLEKKLGFEGLPRFIVEHEKADGRIHLHVMWGRIDPETMKARDCGNNFQKHERASREIENTFDLERGRSTLEPGIENLRPTRRPKDWEGFQQQKTGISGPEMKAELTELQRSSDNGRAFVAAIESRGYIVAQGDRRDFVVLDHAGGVHDLARRIDGMKAADVRAFMKDVDRDALPEVADAREQQRAKFTRDDVFDRNAAAQAWRERPGMSPDRFEREAADITAPYILSNDQRPGGRDAGQVWDAFRENPAGPAFEHALHMQGSMLAAVSSEEAAESYRAAVYATEIGRYSSPLREGEIVAVSDHGNVTRLTQRTTGASPDNIERHLVGVDRAGLLSIGATQEVISEMRAEDRLESYLTYRSDNVIQRLVVGMMHGDGNQPGEHLPLRERLEGAGLIIARASAADVTQLTNEHYERAGSNAPLEWAKNPTLINEGDFVAVTRKGKAFHLNPFQVDYQEHEKTLSRENRLAGERVSFMSVGEARELRTFESEKREFDRELRAEQRQQDWQDRPRGGRSNQSGNDGGIAGFAGTAGVIAEQLGKLGDALADILTFGGASSSPTADKTPDDILRQEMVDHIADTTQSLAEIQASRESPSAARSDHSTATTEDLNNRVSGNGDAAAEHMRREEWERRQGGGWER